VSNLIDNAIKYTPEGGRVRVSARAAGDEVVIEVADSGIGIPAEDLPRIFERFYRVDKSRSREMGGTGLGLSIVKHVVQVHGGIVDVESTVGKGTTFRVKLPAITS
jgi:two-component system phosphate regulon sensor histidine kinase PhoR